MKIHPILLPCFALLLGGCAPVTFGPDAPDSAFQARAECQQRVAASRVPTGNRDIALHDCMESKRGVMEAYGQPRSQDGTFTLPVEKRKDSADAD